MDAYTELDWLDCIIYYRRSSYSLTFKNKTIFIINPACCNIEEQNLNDERMGSGYHGHWSLIVQLEICLQAYDL